MRFHPERQRQAPGGREADAGDAAELLRSMRAPGSDVAFGPSDSRRPPLDQFRGHSARWWCARLMPR